MPAINITNMHNTCITLILHWVLVPLVSFSVSLHPSLQKQLQLSTVTSLHMKPVDFNTTWSAKRLLPIAQIHLKRFSLQKERFFGKVRKISASQQRGKETVLIGISRFTLSRLYSAQVADLIKFINLTQLVHWASLSNLIIMRKFEVSGRIS